jgi:hypothetical protein
MDIAPLNEKTGYVRWMKSQGLPIHVGHGMADLRALAVVPYSRIGAKRLSSISMGCRASPAAISARLRLEMR